MILPGTEFSQAPGAVPMTVIRSILAIFVGLILMGITVPLVEAVGHGSYPIPTEINETAARYDETRSAVAEGTADGRDLADARAAFRDAVSSHVETAPIGALLFVVASWVVGGFVGALAAAVLAGRWRIPIAIVVGLLDVMGILAVVVEIPHPVWMTVLGVIGTMVAVILAGGLAQRMAGFRPAPEAG